MKVDLQGRIALVTGAAQGIGRAIALAIAENGALVAINDIDPSGEETAKQVRQLGQKSIFLQADVGDAPAVGTMVTAAEKELGAIDILVNNAGINILKERRPIHEYSDFDWNNILRVDLNGVFYCSRAVSAGMVSRNRGTIINIGSVLGIVPIRLQSAFAVAKAGVLHFTRCIALELGPYGVRVNAIAPGSIATKSTKELFYNPASALLAESLLSHVALGRPGEPEDIANAVLYLASDDAKYITGSVLTVDGGWTAGFAREW